MALGIDGFEDFLIEDEHTICLQPATSPVWDTAWVVVALREAGLDNTQAALIKAAKWLLSKEIRLAGDWQVLNPGIEPGGWSFEFVNDWYPDLDDTALVPRALLRVGLKGEAVVARSQAIRRAIDWTLGMQSSNGGWGAFDKDNNKQALAHVPFADFMSPLDPTCADVTAHALEFLAEVSQGDEAKRRGIQYLKRTQEKDGAWYGRWGVNYIYGTGLALASLAAVGEQMDQPFVRKAVDWLVSRQNPDGGWGETCMTYIDPSLRGQGPSTASQTAWALTGLLAAGESLHPATEKAVEYLLDTQQPEGDWEEPYFTGTGFPRVFYLRYDLYRVYFPLIALAHYYRAVDDHDQ
jgi:squalene-hopene/tetraprenyl-beta-curcumene cyclase